MKTLLGLAIATTLLVSCGKPKIDAKTSPDTAAKKAPTLYGNWLTDECKPQATGFGGIVVSYSKYAVTFKENGELTTSLLKYSDNKCTKLVQSQEKVQKGTYKVNGQEIQSTFENSKEVAKATFKLDGDKMITTEMIKNAPVVVNFSRISEIPKLVAKQPAA